MSDIVIHKKQSIERCIRQIHSYYSKPSEVPFSENLLCQDAIATNIYRAWTQVIDLANHTIRIRKLGLPNTSRESFSLLSKAGIIPNELAGNLEKMVAFRNILVHDYHRFDIAVMIDVIENRLDDLLAYTNLIVKEFQK